MYDLDRISKKIDVTLDNNTQRAVIVGLVVQKILENQANKQKRLSAVVNTLLQSIIAGQIKLYFDHTGLFIGYACWATLDASIEQRNLREQNFELNQQNRISGSNLWITDLVVSNGHIHYVLSDMRDGLFKDFNEITYFRMKSNKRIAKRIRRDGKYTFFRKISEACDFAQNLIHPYPTKKSVTMAREIGSAALVLGRSKKYALAALAQTMPMIMSAITLRQYKIYFDEDNNPSGMIIWGWLSAYTMGSKPVCPVFALPLGEWNEGDHLCIIDVLSSPNDVSHIVSDFMDNISPDEIDIYTYSSLNSPQPIHFSLWSRNDRAALIASLAAQL